MDFSRGGDLPPVTCEQDGVTVSLAGKVDRVDGYIRDGRLYLRVMDYKSGKKSFSLSDIWYGLNMQLIIYLYALQEEGLDRYRRLLANVEGGLVFSRDGEMIWQCSNCGHIHVGKQAPEMCPVCAHPKAYFQLKAENY